MRRTPIRLLAAVAAVVLAGLAVAALSRDEAPKTISATSHGDVKLIEGEERRVLNAAQAASSSTAPDELAAEGRTLFRNPAIYEEGESCQSCHAEGSSNQKLGVITHDREATAQPGRPAPPTDFNGPRDAPSLWNLEATAPYQWNGDVQTLEGTVLRAMKGHMKRFVSGDCQGEAASSEACATETGEQAAQLVAYLKTLSPPTTDFDQGTLSPAALRGEAIFQGKGGCIECHGGPSFTDNGIHNTGVPQVTFDSPYGTGRKTSDDMGAPAPPLPQECQVDAPPEGCEPDDRQTGRAFINTPQLRDVAASAPYMHNGIFPTLRSVVDFYNAPSSAVGPLNLTNGEMDDLVAYLESL